MGQTCIWFSQGKCFQHGAVKSCVCVCVCVFAAELLLYHDIRSANACVIVQAVRSDARRATAKSQTLIHEIVVTVA